jgi:hypothetical protein
MPCARSAAQRGAVDVNSSPVSHETCMAVVRYWTVSYNEEPFQDERLPLGAKKTRSSSLQKGFSREQVLPPAVQRRFAARGG